MVKFRCPKKNFDRKIQKLYMRFFEKNLPQRQIHLRNEEINEEGEGDVMGKKNEMKKTPQKAVKKAPRKTSGKM